jgi:adenosylhomocysteine nucleosidase
MELEPVRSELGLVASDEDDKFARTYTATHGTTEVVARLTGIGMKAAAVAAERLLESEPVDHVLVVGIAGGVGKIALGTLVIPEVVVNGDTGDEYRSTPLDGSTASGRLESSDNFLVTDEDIAKFVARGVIAVDMETASIAAVCAQHKVPWTAFRGISDLAGETPLEVAAMANTDGSANLKAVLKYLLPRPWKLFHLGRLAKDSKRAAEVAAAAAARAVAQIEPAASQ